MATSSLRWGCKLLENAFKFKESGPGDPAVSDWKLLACLALLMQQSSYFVMACHAQYRPGADGLIHLDLRDIRLPGRCSIAYVSFRQSVLLLSTSIYDCTMPSLHNRNPCVMSCWLSYSSELAQALRLVEYWDSMLL